MRKAAELDTEAIEARFLESFRESSDEDREAGLRWYNDAHLFAESIAKATGNKLSIDHIAAIIAVTSPTVGWEQQKITVPRIVEAWMTGKSADQVKLGIGAFIKKAFDIMSYDEFECISGHKVTSFYYAIAGDQDSVVLDRWMYRIALDDYTIKQGNPAQYEAIADCLRRAARKVHIPPREFQAILWVWVRRTRG